MAEYISTIIYICIFSVILELILPNNKLNKYIGVLVSLVIILTLLTPIINVLKNNDVVAVISDTLNNVQSNIKIKEYDFSNLQNRIIFSSVKEDIEDDIYSKCKQKYDEKFKVSKVRIILDEEYMIGNIDVYVKRLDEIASAAQIISYISKEYEIDASIINVIKEDT